MSGREGPCGALGKKICQAEGSLDIGDTKDACPITTHLIDRWDGCVDA
jgi:hypothetical protein